MPRRLKLKPRPIKLVALVPDTHCGSTVGLCPPMFPTDEGSEYGANPVQKWVWSQWEECWRWADGIIGSDPWAAVGLGDQIEGRHHGTMQLIHHDVLVHLRLAEHVLSPIAEKCDKLFLVRGTEVHTRTMESALGLNLGAEHDPSTRDSCWEQLQLKVAGVRCHFKHHIGVALVPWTKSAQLARALIAEQVHAVALGHETPRVVVRAHRHEFGMYRGSEGLMVACPPWQMLTRYGRMVTKQSFSIPGLVILDFRSLDADGLPVVHYKLCRPDPDTIVEL